MEKLERRKSRSIPALKRKNHGTKASQVDHQVWWRVHGELSGWFLPVVVTRVAPNLMRTSDVLSLLCKNKLAVKTNLTPYASMHTYLCIHACIHVCIHVCIH